MEKYSRWVNKDNTLFVLVAKWSKPKIHNRIVSSEKTTVELLDVHDEKIYEVTYAYFEESIRTGELKQLLKPIKKQ